MRPRKAMTRMKQEKRKKLPLRTSRMRSGRATAAVSTLCLMVNSCQTACRGFHRRRGTLMAPRLPSVYFVQLIAGTPKTPLPGLIIAQCPMQLAGIEIGPVDLGKIEFGIGQLPEQEIADPHLAAGADEKVRIRHLRGKEIAVEHGIIDRSGGNPACCEIGGQKRRGADDLLAPAVREGQGKGHAGVAGG